MTASSTRCAALRDQSRRVIARHGARPDRGDRHPVAEDQAQQRARLLHRGDRQPSGDHERVRRGQGALHPSPDHGERDALHHHRARRTRDEDRQRRRPRAGDRAWRVRPALRRGGGRGRCDPRRAPTRWRCSTCRPPLPAGRGGELLPAGRRRQPRLRGRRRAASGRRTGAAEAGREPFVANDCDLSPEGDAETARSGCSPAPTWAASRPSCARTR